MKQINAPDHLSPETQAWFRQIVSEYELESHHLRLLELAGSAWDEFQAARAAVATHGMTFVDRYGQPRERPEIGIARQARVQFARLVRELAFDVEPPPTRPPRLGGQKH